MAYGEYESYFIKEEELHLVLAGAGLLSWYGLTSDYNRDNDKEPATTQDVNRILASLYQKNLLEWENATVKVLEPLNTVIEILKRAKWCLQIESPDEEIPLRGCYYSNGKVAMMEKSLWETNTLRFSLWEKTDFLNFLWETGLFPEEEIEAETEMETSPEIERVVLSLRDKGTGQEVGRMTITEEGIYPYLWVWKELDVIKKPYNKSECQKILTDWFCKQ